jgi:hypothetical protein
MANFTDLTGQKFNMWTVISRAENRVLSKSKQIKTYWLCKCDCGTFKEVYSNSLTSGKSKSCHCIKRHPYGHASRRNIFSCYVSKAKRRNLEFTITECEFNEMTKQNCYYCGDAPSNIHQNKKMNGEYIYNGIDRIDNTIGYIKENCVASCKDCNLAKRELSQIQFFNMIKKIYEVHLNEKK